MQFLDNRVNFHSVVSLSLFALIILKVFGHLSRIIKIDISILICLVVVLAACQPTDALPTAASLPTVDPVATVSLAPILALEAVDTQEQVLNEVTVGMSQVPTNTPKPQASHTATLSPTATITNTPTVTPTPLPLDIDFERVYPIALPLRAPLLAALNSDRSALTTHRYTLSAYKERGGWVKILLVPTILIEQNWQNVETYSRDFVELIGWQERGQWQMARFGSREFYAVQDLIPEEIIARAIVPPPLAGEYLFPWAKGQTWWAIQGWHDGNALDFQPVTGQRANVLAAESGWLREICGDGYQSFLELRHADGRSTFYLHLTLPRSVRDLLDHPVQRGQFLGELFGKAHFATDCGRGLSRHLHFVSSDTSLVMNGSALSELANVASCCAAPPMVVSSNVKVEENP